MSGNSGDYAPVNVPVTSFSGYSMSVSLLGVSSEGYLQQALAQVGTDALNGFQGVHGPYANPAAGAFPEGQIMYFFVNQRFKDHQAFLNDLRTGLTCIGDAAQVIGNLYHNTDETSAGPFSTPTLDSQADVNAVNFAFAAPGATTPAGTQSWAYSGGTYQDQNAGGSYGPMSADPTATPVRVQTYGEAGGTTEYFSDGSYRVVRQTLDGDVVTYYDAKGNAMGSTGKGETLNPDGTLGSQTQTQTWGDATTGGSQKTVITYNANGSVTVTTTTNSWVDGKAGTPQVTTQTVQGDPTGGSQWDNPMLDYEQQYGTSGDMVDPELHAHG
jgi:hypothetical protein